MLTCWLVADILCGGGGQCTGGDGSIFEMAAL
jgi:hypothetical protein